MTRSWNALAILVAALILPAAVFAQTGEAPGRTQGVMTGTAADASGAGVAGTEVKIFEEGSLLAETTTEADGRYRLEFEFLPDIDWTIVVWFVPPEGELIPEIVILRESLKSKDLNLWSTCLPRLDLEARIRYDASLLNEADKLAEMSELDCMQGGDR